MIDRGGSLQPPPMPLKKNAYPAGDRSSGRLVVHVLTLIMPITHPLKRLITDSMLTTNDQPALVNPQFLSYPQSHYPPALDNNHLQKMDIERQNVSFALLADRLRQTLGDRP